MSVLNNIDTIKKYLESFMYFLGIVHILCLDIGLYDVHAKIVILFKMRRKKNKMVQISTKLHIHNYIYVKNHHIQKRFQRGNIIK